MKTTDNGMSPEEHGRKLRLYQARKMCTDLIEDGREPTEVEVALAAQVIAFGTELDVLKAAGPSKQLLEEVEQLRAYKRWQDVDTTKGATRYWNDRCHDAENARDNLLKLIQPMVDVVDKKEQCGDAIRDSLGQLVCTDGGTPILTYADCEAAWAGVYE